MFWFSHQVFSERIKSDCRKWIDDLGSKKVYMLFVYSRKTRKLQLIFACHPTHNATSGVISGDARARQYGEALLVDFYYLTSTRFDHCASYIFPKISSQHHLVTT